MFDFVLALRNLFRHRVRSAIALSAIVFGVVALLLSGGFIEWIFFAMREAVIESRFGHIQVARQGYSSEGAADPFAFLLPAQSPVLTALNAEPSVRLVTERLAFSGLISHGDTSISFMGEGVDPELEAQVSRQLIISEGEDLSSEDPQGVILGEGLAAHIGLKPGDTVVLLATAVSGGINIVEGHVRGLFYTSTKEFDDTSLRVPISLARRLLKVSGSHTWVVLLHKTENTAVTLRQMKSNFKGEAEPLEFVPWNELADFYNKAVTLFSEQINIVRGIIAIIIIFSISNTLTMSVLERTGEIGTLMAMGNTRHKVLKLFITEGFLLGVVGGIVGLLLGIVLAHVISAMGIPMPPPPGMSRGLTGKIFISWSIAMNALVITLSIAVLASIYPAWKGSHIKIVDALRHNR